MIPIKSSKELIEELNLLDESDSIEAKEISGSDVGKSVYETISAFSNEPMLGGGTILLGVKREYLLFPLYTATGIKDPDKISNDIVSACQNIFNHAIRPVIKRDIVDGQVILRVDVSELPPVQKPLYLKKSALPQGAFRRIGGADIRCNPEDLAAFYQDRRVNTYDMHVIPDSEIEDIDVGAISAYRKAIASNNPTSEILDWSDSELLFGVSALKKVNDKPRLTATGLLMFGRSPSLRRFFPTNRVDYIRIQGKQWVSNTDHRFDSMDIRDPIISLISRVIFAVAGDLPKTFKLDDDTGGQRHDIPVIPHAALREAIVNAVMHRNYEISRPIQILRYSNRLVIENPGFSLKTPEQYDDPGSISRNPNIAAILHETRFAETKGSGMRVMRQLLRNVGLSAPTFESDRENDIFRVTFLFHHFLGKEDWQWLKHFSEFKLTDDQLRALVYVRETSQINNAIFRDLTGLDTLTASAALRKLRDIGLLDIRGSGSQSFWVAGSKLSPHIHSSIETMEPRLQDLQPRLQDLNENPIKSIISRFPPELRSNIVKLSLSKKTDAELMRNMIIEMCRYVPLSTEQLAQILNRDKGYIAQAYLSPMVQSESILQTIPDTPNHPDQKYTAK